MIVRIRQGEWPDTYVPVLCDDAGDAKFELGDVRVDWQAGDVLDIRLPGVDWAQLIKMT